MHISPSSITKYMPMEQSSILSRLKKAVKKVKFLLNFSLNRWRIASMIGAPSTRVPRSVSFNDRPGLKECTDYFCISPDDHSLSSNGSPSLRLSRTASYPVEDDVDKRADMFITNFYRQLQIERQVSLELRYCRGNSFCSISP